MEIQVGDRVLGVYDGGNPGGPAILQHHGTPAAGGPWERWVQDAQARGARLVAYDRPGYGASSPHPGRTVADAATDAAAIMDALGVERFVTWGISGGGPHALACAALLGDRVTAVASLAGIAPFDAPGLNFFAGMGRDNWEEFGLTLAGRDAVKPWLEHGLKAMTDGGVDVLITALDTLVGEADRQALREGFGEYWAAGLPATGAQGVTGWLDDDLAFVEPFGFDLAAIAAPTLILHGREDQMVPVTHGEWLARRIAGAEAWITADDGHLTLMSRRIPAVHEWLLSR